MTLLDTSARRSAVDGRQIESAESLWIGQDIHLNDLASALIAHFSLGDGPGMWSWAAATGVLWGLSYFFWRRLQATPASA